MRALLRWYNPGRGQICVHYGAVLVYWDPPQLQLGAACCFWPLKINLNIYRTLSNIMKQLCKVNTQLFMETFSVAGLIFQLFLVFIPRSSGAGFVYFPKKTSKEKPAVFSPLFSTCNKNPQWRFPGDTSL